MQKRKTKNEKRKRNKKKTDSGGEALGSDLLPFGGLLLVV
jgi:hypothetical protein